MESTESQEPFAPIQYMAQIERMIACFLDILVIGVIIFILNKLGFYFEKSTSIYSISFFILIVFYFIYSEYKWGQTIGKRIMKIKIFMENGKPTTLKASLIRNLFRVFYYTGIGFIIDLILLYKTEKKQRLGDIITHTVVVKLYPKGHLHLQPPQTNTV